MNCGLLGRKLGHSYSPQIHGYLGDYSYRLFEKEPEELADFLRHGDFTGLNVTIPYKKEVIPFLDELSDTARKMESVNTILRRKDGTLFGHNSDYFGFCSLVRHSGMGPAGKKVLVLGSGGTSAMAQCALTDMGARVIVISRSGPDNYGNLERHADAAMVVNATPLGMYPNVGTAALDLRAFPRLEGVLDVVYNPARTALLLQAEQLHIPCANGLWMLVAQAKEAAEYFTGRAIDDSVIEKIYGRLSAQMENIVLIGMPGCGKSTVGAILAEKTGRTLLDADERICELAGKSIPEIFAQDGEAAFRQWETEALREFGMQSGRILATGGGCVTQSRNYPLLHQNGRIFYLTRDLDRLPTDGRPLSQANPLAELYAARKGLYEAFADMTVDNNGRAQDTAETILNALEGSL